MLKKETLGKCIVGIFLFCGLLSAVSDNLLESPAMKWSCRYAEGASGSMKKLPDGSFEVIRNNASGYAFFINDSNLPLIPGRYYRARVTFQTFQPEIKGRLMLSMPGGKRRPFPVSSDIAPMSKSGTLELEFLAAPDEKNLRLHLTLHGGAGRTVITRMELENVPPPAGGDALSWTGRDLLRAWRPAGVLRTLASESVEAETLAGGGIACDILSWNASAVKAVEIEFRASDEGGFVQMEWGAEKDSRKISGGLTRSIPPDGQWHTLVFDVSKDPDWTGTIKSLRFSWSSLYASSRIGLRAVRALPVANVIPGAASLTPDAAVKIDMIKPRGEYSLSWQGKNNPGVRLDLCGLDGEILQTESLASGTDCKNFTVPEYAAYGRLRLAGNGDGYPVLILKNLKQLGLPADWWKASWIWSRNEPAPRGNVWFGKRFTLPGKVHHAEVLMSGDDTVDVRINGKLFTGGSDWAKASRSDVTAALREGENEIVARVGNAEAWGAFIFELRGTLADGKTFCILSDESWTSHEGGDEPPSQIGNKVFVFGVPPVPPWGLRITYPSGAEKKGREIVSSAVLDSMPAKARFTGAGQRTWLEINGERFAPLYFDLPNYSEAPERKAVFVRNAVKGGNRIIRISAEIRKIWVSRDKINFAFIDEACENLLREAPDAYVILIVSSFMPDWWLKENPADATAFSGGEAPVMNNDFQSLASRKWLDDADMVYRRIIGHILKQRYGSRIIGMAPADGSTWEWMWSGGRGHKGRAFCDYSPVAVAAYRSFLKNRYHNDSELAAAWAKPGLTFDAVTPPTPERRDSSSLANFLDPRRDRELIDWYDFRNQIVSDDIIHLCRTIKEASGNRWITGTYYGYLVMFSYMQFMLQEGGHLGIHKIATSPYVDFVIGPTLYHWRRLGMGDDTMQPTAAFTSHGKPVICELDYRTFADPTDYERRNGKVDTVEQTAAVMNRGLGLLLSRGLAGHYMELHDRWFLEPVLLKVMNEQHRLYESLPEKPAGLTPVEVCIVSDELSPLYVKNNLGDGIHTVLIAEFLRRFGEAGFPYRHVLLSDLLTPGLLPAHKFYILTNTMVLSDSQRKSLKERFAREKASVLYLYAPGAFYPDFPASSNGVDEMTGMQTRMLVEKRPMNLIAEKDFGGITISCRTAAGPWFPIVGGYDFVIGKDASGQVLAAGRKQGEGITFFSTVPNLPPELIRILVSQAGVHIYSRSGDPMHIGNDVVFLHAKTGGEKSVILPPGTRMRAIAGPLKGTFESGQAWNAESGQTYGFLVEKK